MSWARGAQPEALPNFSRSPALPQLLASSWLPGHSGKSLAAVQPPGTGPHPSAALIFITGFRHGRGGAQGQHAAGQGFGGKEQDGIPARGRCLVPLFGFGVLWVLSLFVTRGRWWQGPARALNFLTGLGPQDLPSPLGAHPGADLRGCFSPRLSNLCFLSEPNFLSESNREGSQGDFGERRQR